MSENENENENGYHPKDSLFLTGWDDIAKEFARPFEDVSSYNAGGKTGVVTYIDARDAAGRLDYVVGPSGWSDTYDVVDLPKAAIRCTLTVLGVTKQGFGYPNLPVGSTRIEKIYEKGKDTGETREVPNDSDEPLKEAESDSLKRAAAKFGIGRHLYKDKKKGNRPGRSQSLGGKKEHEEDATEAQQTEAVRLLQANGSKPPANGYRMKASEAAAIIARLRKQVEQAKSSAPGPSQGEDHAPSPVDFKPASENQLATITKLSTLLGEPDRPDGASMSSAQASDRITELSRAYNEKRGVRA